MKYGVIYYKDTDNIGDDIQSYASAKFLPRIDCLIDREHLDDFGGDEPVAVIMNGWFLYHKFNWPPAQSILPLCVSMHFTPNDYMSINYQYLDGIGGEYLKNYQPVGCRDQSTYDILTQKGIGAYLSGCITLTLELHKQRKRDTEKYICAVDIDEEAENRIKALTDGKNIEIRKTTHLVDYKEHPIAWQERMCRVEELLDLYQSAHCIVTKRLHCALPCLAMGVPVLLLLDEKKDDMTRYSHFVDLLHVSSTEDFVRGNCNFSLICPPENKEIFRKEREQLINRVEEFIAAAEEGLLPDAYKRWRVKDVQEIIKWQRDLAGTAAVHAAGRVDRLLIERGRIEKQSYEKVCELSRQYEKDMGILREHLSRKEAEEKRINNIIISKEQEERRLNSVIADKRQEEKRLNNIIADQEREKGRLNNVIADQEREKGRLNSVIRDKEQEEKRLNHVIRDKEQEEKRLNNIISSQEQEKKHLNNILAEKEEEWNQLSERAAKKAEEIHRLSSLFEETQNELSDKTQQLDNVYGQMRNNEKTSVVWLIFFSEEFAQASFKHKCKIIIRAVKNKGKRKRFSTEIFD